FKYMIHLRRIGIEILKNANRIVFLSETYRNNVIENYVPQHLKKDLYNKTSVVPNGIDEYWFRNKGHVKTLKRPNEIKLLQVGVINKNKNIEITVKSIEYLREKGFNVQLSLVGRIEDYDLFNKIKDLNYVNYISPKRKEE